MNELLSRIEPSATLQLAAKARALAAQGKDIIDLTAGEPDFQTPKHICDAAKAAIDAGKTRYTPSAGILELREEIAKKLKHENDLSYTAGEIIATSGGKQAIALALQVLCNSGDEVFIPSPYWVSYPAQAYLAGATPVFVSTDGNGITRAARIEKKITTRSRVLILDSPSNPSGAVIPKDELERIAHLAAKHDLQIISDEVYEHFLFAGEHVSIAAFPGMRERTLTVGSCSKTYAMTGWRIGWCAGPKAIIEAMTTIQSHVTSAPSSIAQHAAVAALTGPQESVTTMREAFAHRRRIVLDALESMRLVAMPMDGAFYAFIDISPSGLSSEEFSSRLLEEHLVALVPGKPFGSDAHVRLSYATDEEILRKGLARIAAFVEARRG